MSADTRPWFKFWHRDFWTSKAVRGMSAEGVTLYLLLLTEQWECGPIEDDLGYWKRVHGSRFSDFESAWKEVRKCFDECDGGIANRRLEEERAQAVKGAENRSKRAKKAASVRWSNAPSTSQACSEHAPSNAKKEREREREKKKEKKTPPSGESARARKAFYERPPLEEFSVLDCDEVREAWAAFIGSEKRKAAGPLAESSVRRHLRELEKLGAETASKCLWYSADGNYPGLYFDRWNSTTRNGRESRTTFADLLAQKNNTNTGVTVDAEPSLKNLLN